MDSDHRTHRTGSNTTTTSELFICFTSRLSSSSSMKISKSSIHSPSRSRDHPTSLSTSLSRRLRPNGSMKGWQASPMFPTGGNKKRGAGFENPEPSSPKVTCIGQVRVKTKKQRKKMQRRHSGREFSFRKVEVTNQNQNQNQNATATTTQNNQGYQQSICEALRSIGAEFSCLLPCKSSCFSMSEGEKGREIELVVGGGEEEEEEALPVRNSRRHVFDNLEIEDLMPKVKKNDDEVVEEGRVSICVPPKNALLLMRCRSDPVKMADLTNRFWDSSVQDDDDEVEYEKGTANVKEFEVIEAGSGKRDSVDVSEERVKPEAEMELKLEILRDEEVAEIAKEDLQISEGVAEETEGNHTVVEEENARMDSSFEALADLEVCESGKDDNVVEEKEEEEENIRETNSSCSFQYSADEEENETEEEEEQEEESISKKLETQQSEERERKTMVETESESERSVLPDCLLLMMCEPKLSMEVSKETWVCSTDFIRHHQPEKKVKQINGGDEPKKEQVVTIDKNSDSITTQHHQPPRSSCSFPAPVIEEKLVSAVGCEPLVLTRCKSAPMRAAAANSKVGQDSCFWKNRNLEPHRRSSVGFGTAGMGF